MPHISFLRQWSRVGHHLLLWLVALVCLLATTTVRADRSPANCTGSGLGITLFTSIPDVHVGDTIFYSINLFNGIVGSGRIVCDATEITAFIVTPDNVIHPINLSRTTLLDGQSDFYLDVVSYVVRAQDILPDGTLNATANTTGTIHQNEQNSTGGGFQEVNTQVNLPCVLLTALCVGGVGENGLITISGTVTNCGNNTLVGVTVTNFHSGGNFTVVFPTNLAIGQSVNFTGSYIPVNPCVPSTAILTVRATDEFTATPRTVTNFASVTCQNTLTPGIKVTKVCPVSPVSPGQLLTFSGSVSNTGNITLTNVVVLNNQPSANTSVFTRATLAPGEVANFTGSYIAPAACSVADTLVATATSRCGTDVSSTASATCPILTTPAIVVTATCPVGPITGNSFTYTGTVRNSGNITLNNIVVTSDRPSANTTVFTIASLAPGATSNFSSTVTIPANACAVATTFSGRGTDSCTLLNVTNTVTTTCNITSSPAIAVTLTCPVGSATSGGPITYTGTVRNSGNVTLNNVFVVNNQPSANTPVIGPITLTPGQTTAFTATFTSPADACSVSSTVTATGVDSCAGNTVSNTASATCTLLTTPGLVLTQNCPVGPVIPGQLLAYTGTIRNSGNVTLTNVVVMNNQSGSTPIFTAASLAPGVTASFNGSYLAPTNCTSASTSTGTATSRCGVATSANITSTCTILTAPAIVVTATCPVGPILAGSSFTYTGTVRNSGNITLNNVVVTSDRPSANTTVFTIASLAPGATSNFSSSVTVPANACAVATTFSGRGTDSCTLLNVTNTVTTTCNVTSAPAIAVTLVCPVISATSGGPITYTGTVRNSGNITLNNVFVVNNQPSANTPVIGPLTLLPGVTTSFTATFTTPADACSVSSTVTATGVDSCAGNTVSNTASATCPLLTTPGLVLTQNCPVGPVIPGQLLAYTGTIRNSGNVTLTNVVVLNNQSGSTPIFTAASLAPGVTASFNGSYLAPTNCTSASTSTGTATSRCGVATTASISSTCTILTAPAIVVTATCPVGPILAGSSFTYTGTVRNSGNITLNNVVVTSDRPSANTTVFTIASLAPGATSAFSSTVTVPANACAVATTFSGRGTDSCTLNNVTNTVTTTCNVTSAPAIAVTLACPVGSATAGGPITYTGTVRNSGNITLNNVFVVNNQPSANTPVIGPLTLLPGVTTSFTATFTTTPDACTVSSTVTATGVDSCLGNTVSNTASATCPLLTTPGILLTQACPIGPVIPGQLLTYTGTIQNTGNITLTNIIVLNNRSGSLEQTLVTNQVLTTNQVVTIGAGAPSTVGLMGYWALNEASGNLAMDTSSQGNNGAILNATHVLGQFGNGLNFNGLNATVSIPNSSGLNFAGAITMAAWIKPQSGVNVQDILSHGIQSPSQGDMSLRIINGQYQVGGFDALPKASAPIPAADFGNYVHLAGVYNGTVWILYRNGVALNTSGNSIGASIVNGPWAIGSRAGGNAQFFNGDIDEVRIYNRALSGAEVLTLTAPGTLVTNSVITTNYVVVTGTTGSTPIFTLASLAPGAVVSFTGSYPAPTECSSTSTSVVTATSVCGGSVTSTASTTCPIQTTPRIVVNQICPTTPVLPGGILTYSGSVSNAGNITLTNIIVVNNQPANGTVIFTAASLAPGASASFNGSYQVPTNCCVVSSTVRATGQGCVGETVSDTATRTCVVATSPQIVVTKVCAPGTLRPGDLLTYSGTVRNAGNITLINVTVVNNHPSANTPVLGPLTLAPGETVNYNVSYIIPADFCGTDTVTASGLDVCTFLPVVDSVTSTCPVVTAPGISVTKICPVVPTPRGSLYTFTGVVRNTGNVTLVNVYVTDNQPTNNTPVLGPITLAPGATFNFSGSYLAPACDSDNCCFIIDTLTARGADRCSGSNVTSTATAVCPLLSQPGIALVQTCPPAPLVMGSIYNYSGFVTNTGDIVLTNVFVFGPQGSNTVLVGPIELAPGEIEFYAGSYTVPFNVCAATVTAVGQDTCGGAPTTNAFNCPVATSPQIAVTASCPVTPVVPGGSLTYNGTVQNTGNITLTNVVVRSDRPVPNTTVFTLSSLAPGAIAAFSGTSTTPTNVCAVATTFQGSGQSICTLASVTNSVTTTCTTTTTPALFLTQNCPPGPVTAGSLVLFNGVVSNSGNITLTNVYVFSSQPSTNPPVLGPITLAPGASAPYAGSYLASSGNNQVTNSVIVTNSVSTVTTNSANVITTNVVVNVTTNTVMPTFGTIDPVSNAIVDRFSISNNVSGLMFGPQDQQWGATLFYATRHPATGPDQFITINAGTGAVTDRFSLTSSNYVALTLAAPDVGHGEKNFYYLRNDGGVVSTFGVIKAAGASSSADIPPALPGVGYNSLAFAEADISGYGANLFYYLREDAGLTTLGTISVAGAMVVTDRYTLGTGMNFDDMVFVPGTVSTWGTAIFAYLRHTATGSIIGSIDPVTHLATDRLSLGTNLLTGLTFTATDVGYGPNMFYYLRPAQNILNTNSVTTFSTNLVVTLTTNTVTTFTTNSVVSFTPANTVTAVGKDICLARTASASANCQATLASVTPGMVVGPPAGNGSFGLSLPTEVGQTYTIQYKNSLSDPVWIDLETVTGTGGTLDIIDAAVTSQPARFYRVIQSTQ